MKNICDYTFNGCTGLVSIAIPDSVTSISDSAFNGCAGLTEISVHENNTHFCSENGILFNKKKTDLLCYPKGKTETSYSIPSGVTNIGDMAFFGCSSLTSVTIPDSMKIIGASAFRDCSSLISITFGGTVANWKSINFKFYWNYNTGAYTVTCTNGTLSK